MNPNGHADGESRLDRLERLFEESARRHEQYEARNERAHEEFETEHKRLLIAQVVMVDNMSKLELKLDKLTGRLDGLIQ
jgi:hypothetical protein